MPSLQPCGVLDLNSNPLGKFLGPVTYLQIPRGPAVTDNLAFIADSLGDHKLGPRTTKIVVDTPLTEDVLHKPIGNSLRY